jgi:hypothetical protein
MVSVIRHSAQILADIVVHPEICLFLLLLAATVYLYVSDKDRKSKEASIRELEALFALRDVRGSVHKRSR